MPINVMIGWIAVKQAPVLERGIGTLSAQRG